jgi:sestrin
MQSASRFECAYLVRQQEIAFLLNDGDPDWLEGVHKIPKKIQNLLEINAILAHQPWLINKEHVTALIKGEDAWSVAELVHALVLMASFRALAGVVWGLGITPEVDYEGLTAQDASADDSAEGEEDSNNAQVIEKLKQGGFHEEEGREMKAEERKHLFEQAGQDANLGDDAARGPSGQGGKNASDICTKYIGSYVMAHVDFDVKAKGYDVFHVEDYSWREQGYELMKTYYSEAANLLEEEFEHISNMTDNRYVVALLGHPAHPTDTSTRLVSTRRADWTRHRSAAQCGTTCIVSKVCYTTTTTTLS